VSLLSFALFDGFFEGVCLCAGRPHICHVFAGIIMGNTFGTNSHDDEPTDGGSEQKSTTAEPIIAVAVAEPVADPFFETEAPVALLEANQEEEEEGDELVYSEEEEEDDELVDSEEEGDEELVVPRPTNLRSVYRMRIIYQPVGNSAAGWLVCYIFNYAS